MLTPRFPLEILDYTIDLLHDDPDALKECCLVSKSWIHRTRKHLFAHVKFITEKRLQSWKEAFPDPFNSPAYHAHTLSINYSGEIIDTDRGAGEWIRGFSRVVHLRVASQRSYTDSEVSFDLLHGLPPTIESLHADFTPFNPSRVLNFIISFPLLESLSVTTHSEIVVGTELSTTIQPQSLPMFTGSLEVSMKGGMKPIARRLLSLSGGIHFRELALKWFREEDSLLTMALLEKCSHTLESLKIACDSHSTSVWHLCLRR